MGDFGCRSLAEFVWPSTTEWSDPVRSTETLLIRWVFEYPIESNAHYLGKARCQWMPQDGRNSRNLDRHGGERMDGIYNEKKK
jgi:hypothetical protein